MNPLSQVDNRSAQLLHLAPKPEAPMNLGYKVGNGKAFKWLEVNKKKRLDSLTNIDPIAAAFRRHPKDERSWKAHEPNTVEDVKSLVELFTLGRRFTLAERASMSYVRLLQECQHLKSEASGGREQLLELVIGGLAKVAANLGKMGSDEVAKVLQMNNKTLTNWRIAAKRVIEITDIIATHGMGMRAYELPLRWKNMATNAGRLTHRHISILDVYLEISPSLIYIPQESLASEDLRIPFIIFTLIGGSERLVEIEDIHKAIGVDTWSPEKCIFRKEERDQQFDRWSATTLMETKELHCG